MIYTYVSNRRAKGVCSPADAFTLAAQEVYSKGVQIGERRCTLSGDS